MAKFDKFHFDIDDDLALALSVLAKNDRKKFSLSAIFGRFNALRIIDSLGDLGLIGIEKSREILPKRQKHQKLKKALRHYQINDKIIINGNFTRFYFRFVYPNLWRLKLGEKDEISALIQNDFENYASFGFEMLSAELLAKHLDMDFFEISSYWSKDEEIDLYAQKDDKILVGEVKYKNRKISKNTLHLLELKCQNLGISPQIYALFSRSGFSENLLKNQNQNLLLFNIEDFKNLI